MEIKYRTSVEAIKDVLELYAQMEVNLSSEVAREMVAESIVEALNEVE